MLDVLVAVALGALELAVVGYIVYRGLFDDDHRRRRDGSDGASARAAASSAAR